MRRQIGERRKARRLVRRQGVEEREEVKIGIVRDKR